MDKCTKFKDCAFTHSNNQYRKLQSIEHYIDDYCRSGKHGECVRFKIDVKHGTIHVPSNMMPNGLPLPGTHRRDWTDIALEHKKHLNDHEF